MATITATRRTYKNLNHSTDAYCMRVTRTDGEVFRFTDAVQDLVMTTYRNGTVISSLPDPVTYQSTYGLNLSAIGQSAGETAQLDVDGMLGALGFGRNELVSGLFNKARVVVFLTDQYNPIQDEEILFGAYWGEVTLSAGRYYVKMHSLLDVLNVDTTRSVSFLCDVKFGSVICGVDLNPSAWQALHAYTAITTGDRRLGLTVKPTAQNNYWFRCTTAGTSGASEPAWNTTEGGTTADGSVVWTTVKALKLTTTNVNGGNGTDGTIQLISPLPAGFADWFENGFVTVNDGNNAGISRRIVGNTTGVFNLDIALPQQMTALSSIALVAGCLKRQEDCVGHNNYLNHQGNPYLPEQRNIYRRGTK